jgi:hypothetical protein
VGEEEQRDDGVAYFLKRGAEVRAQEWEEKVRWESEERGEEDTQGQGGVDGPAEPDAHVLHLWYRGLVPATKDGLGQAGEERAIVGGRMGELGVAVSVVVRGQRSQVVGGVTAIR